jgi:hypothetical protein
MENNFSLSFNIKLFESLGGARTLQTLRFICQISLQNNREKKLNKYPYKEPIISGQKCFCEIEKMLSGKKKQYRI